ncbi:hypothetical protein [Priestia megaterium]|uniref:hypothetical protein n=1 Tax=Priestia megaterium TaxID=1404 RepID=UPI00112EABF6|nr:hypothetical protein [Priestia megaterium]TPF17990.1 hypothetical protein CBE78_01830 [Priestia megaterium]TPF22098.1 hypothetical protein CBE79_04335 [Priestia megaterium]
MISYLLNSLINIIFLPVFAGLMIGYPFYKIYKAKDKKKEVTWWLKSTLVLIVFFIAPIVLTFFFLTENDTKGIIAGLILCVLLAKVGLGVINTMED